MQQQASVNVYSYKNDLSSPKRRTESSKQGKKEKSLSKDRNSKDPYYRKKAGFSLKTMAHGNAKKANVSSRINSLFSIKLSKSIQEKTEKDRDEKHSVKINSLLRNPDQYNVSNQEFELAKSANLDRINLNDIKLRVSGIAPLDLKRQRSNTRNTVHVTGKKAAGRVSDYGCYKRSDADASSIGNSQRKRISTDEDENCSDGAEALL